MSTLQDFENAKPGDRAVKDADMYVLSSHGGPRPWLRIKGAHAVWRTATDLTNSGYTLVPDTPAPARTPAELVQALWDTCYPVKKDQTIPAGTRHVTRYSGNFRVATEEVDIEVCGLVNEKNTRTFEPLPEPLPDWLEAPAVLARPEDDTWIAVWQPCQVLRCSESHGESRWTTPREGNNCRSWQDLRDVTPLYPKETDE